MKKSFIVLFSILFLDTTAQEIKQSVFAVHYTYQIPVGDLATTFGNNSAVGASYFLETKNNILYGIESNYIFGGEIKDSSIFSNINTSNNEIISANGYYANINLMERGFDSHLFFGYAFHLSKKTLSGIYVTQGFGYLQHQIFIDTKNQDIPQLNEDMKKGYDRFSNGFSTKSSIDYKYYDKNGKFQISLGTNYTIAHTKIQRTYDFANNKYYSNKKSWDQLLGIKIEIIIPIHRKNEEIFHYY